MYDNNNSYYQPAPQQPPRRDIAAKVLSIVALVNGIVGLCCFWNYVLGLVCGIGAIVTGSIARKRDNANRRAKTGLILGIIATVLSIIFLVLFIVGVIALSGSDQLDMDFILDGIPVVDV